MRPWSSADVMGKAMQRMWDSAVINGEKRDEQRGVRTRTTDMGLHMDFFRKEVRLP